MLIPVVAGELDLTRGFFKAVFEADLEPGEGGLPLLLFGLGAKLELNWSLLSGSFLIGFELEGRLRIPDESLPDWREISLT